MKKQMAYTSDSELHYILDADLYDFAFDMAFRKSEAEIKEERERARLPELTQALMDYFEDMEKRRMRMRARMGIND